MSCIVTQVIKEETEKMFKVYTDEAYPIVLANNISDRHIAILKNKRREEREKKKEIAAAV